jgi:cadmium resistance protein CadD (predicted permease)
MDPVALAGVAVLSFASTNVDNFLVTTAQLAAAKPGRTRRIVEGEMFGTAVLVGASALVAAALVSIPTRWFGLLGLVPLTLGLRGLWALRRPEARVTTQKWPLAGGFTTSTAVTLGNGGDNLAVYIPLFRGTSVAGGALVVAVFAILDVLLCVAAVLVGRHPKTLRAVERGGVVVTPIVYCLIGVVVLLRAGTLSSLL